MWWCDATLLTQREKEGGPEADEARQQVPDSGWPCVSRTHVTTLLLERLLVLIDKTQRRIVKTDCHPELAESPLRGKDSKQYDLS